MMPSTVKTPTTVRRCPPQEHVGGRQPAEADFATLRRQMEERDQRRQEGDGAGEGDEHADAGDQPKFGDAREAGWDEGEEAGRDGNSREQHGGAGLAQGLLQRDLRMRREPPLIAIAHRDLDREVDGKADKEHREGDGDQVEGPDRDGGEEAS